MAVKSPGYGRTGKTGAQGSVGAPGAQGAAGPAGVAGLKGETGAQGIPGATGLTGATGQTGTQGPAGFSTVTTAASSRALGAAFQPSTTKATLVSYSVKTQVTNPLLAGTSTSIVTLFSDASNPPTTERCRAGAESGVGLAVTIALTTSNTTPLLYLVPAGHFVRLVASGTGTHSESIISQTEEVLG
jgi:hypothetical protein